MPSIRWMIWKRKVVRLFRKFKQAWVKIGKIWYRHGNTGLVHDDRGLQYHLPNRCYRCCWWWWWDGGGVMVCHCRVFIVYVLGNIGLLQAYNIISQTVFIVVVFVVVVVGGGGGVMVCHCRVFIVYVLGKRVVYSPFSRAYLSMHISHGRFDCSGHLQSLNFKILIFFLNFTHVVLEGIQLKKDHLQFLFPRLRSFLSLGLLFCKQSPIFLLHFYDVCFHSFPDCFQVQLVIVNLVNRGMQVSVELPCCSKQYRDRIRTNQEREVWFRHESTFRDWSPTLTKGHALCSLLEAKSSPSWFKCKIYCCLT